VTIEDLFSNMPTLKESYFLNLRKVLDYIYEQTSSKVTTECLFSAIDNTKMDKEKVFG